MPDIYQNVTSAILPSGELAEWTFWSGSTDQAIAQSSYTAWATYLSTSTTWTNLFTTTTAFREGRVNQVDQATGTVLAAYTAGVAYSGSGLGGALPPQCAEVITLRTARAGSSFTGRMYLPAVAAVAMGANGRLLTATYSDLCDEMAAAFSAFLAADSANVLYVYSRVHRSVEAVMSIDCGDVIDTQRRRRDKLVEVRHSATL